MLYTIHTQTLHCISLSDSLSFLKLFSHFCVCKLDGTQQKKMTQNFGTSTVSRSREGDPNQLPFQLQRTINKPSRKPAYPGVHRIHPTPLSIAENHQQTIDKTTIFRGIESTQPNSLFGFQRMFDKPSTKPPYPEIYREDPTKLPSLFQTTINKNAFQKTLESQIEISCIRLQN